jgi:hypothetical protein
VEEADLMEDPIRELSAANGSLAFDLRPFEVKTMKLHFEPPATAARRRTRARSPR